MADFVLEARELRKSYAQAGGPAVEVLRGIDLALRPGEFVAVLGPSGSGKSTLLHLLGLMDEPTGGEVLFHGRPTRTAPDDLRAALRNRGVGFVFQFDSLLPEFTVLENVMLPGLIPGPEGARPWAAVESRGRNLSSASASPGRTVPSTSPAGSVSGPPWRGPSSTNRPWCSPMSPPGTWTGRTAKRFLVRCGSWPWRRAWASFWRPTTNTSAGSPPG